jgi:lysozyme family protein
MTFEQAVEHVLREEGGYQNARNDRGNWSTGRIGEGELRGTNFGISAASYPQLDIQALTKQAAAAIYRRDYWQAAQCEALPPLLRLAVFDAAVNCGVGTAVRWAQAVAGVDADGKVGPRTREAWAGLTNVERVVDEYMWLRVMHHARIARPASQQAWLPGWILRCGRVRSLCLE